MRHFLDDLARRGVAIDPTLSLYESRFVARNGDLPPAYQAWEGRLPPAIARQARAGTLAPTDTMSRDTMRASFAKLVELVGELHRRHVTIVAGTDEYGIELTRELELYVQAGMSPAEALASATIVPATVFRLDALTGSIDVGKLAELTLVAGNPGKKVGDIRNVELVLRDGRILDAARMREAAGLSVARRSGATSRAH